MTKIVMKLAVSMIALCGSMFAQQQCQQTCLQGLTVATYSEYKISEKTTSHQVFQQDFCDTVHSLQQGKTSDQLSGTVKKISLDISHDQETLAQYDHQYCQNTYKENDFSNAYSFWAKVANHDALHEFNVCMRDCNSHTTVTADVQERGTCGFVATVSAPAYDEKDAPIVKDVVLVNAACKSLPSCGDKLLPRGQNIECTRFGRSGSFISITTDKGPVVIGPSDIAEPIPPQTPVMEFREEDENGKRYSETFRLSTDQYKKLNNCETCSGTFYLTDKDAVIPDAGHVSYACYGGANQNNDALCGFSYSTKGGYGSDVEPLSSGNNFTWHRKMQTSQNVDEVYTALYQKKRCVANCGDYEAALAEYKKKLAENPCPWTPPTTWGDRLRAMFTR